VQLSLTSLHSVAETASGLIGAFGQWWLSEFLALFPPTVAKWLMGRGSLSLVLGAQEDAVTLELLDESRQAIASASIPIADYDPAAIEHFLTLRGLAHEDIAIGIRLPPENVFGRKLILPIEAAQSLDRIVVQDLIARTPFRPNAIYHDYATIGSSGSRQIIVWQWVTRREFVEDALALLRLDQARVAFIDVKVSENAEAPPPRIALRHNTRGRRPWARTTAVALASSALLLATIVVGLESRRQAAIIDDLDHQLTTARSRAQQVQAAVDKLAQKQAVLFRLRSQKIERPGLLDAWAEVTRQLPTHSWLTELRLMETTNKEEQQITMTGFSAAASSLVGLLDQSPLFIDAALTAPIALDAAEQRERFALQAKLRSQHQIQRASR
jgi:general secretion pathway protein L